MFEKDLPYTIDTSMMKSRNKEGMVKNYTDGEAILADKVLHDSFDHHFDRWKLGEISLSDNQSDSIKKEPNSIISSMGQTIIGNAHRQSFLP